MGDETFALKIYFASFIFSKLKDTCKTCEVKLTKSKGSTVYVCVYACVRMCLCLNMEFQRVVEN